MTNVTIFKSKDAVVSTGARELSDFAKSLSTGGTTSRRIQTNTNGTFKRIINGEQLGNAVRGEINVIIIHALPKVSRIYYAEKFDPNKEATLPDCWSNLGDRPEVAAANKQHTNCADCSMNIKGSGDNGGRACRFQRRISVLLADDLSGDVYQFNVPAKSLFGKGTGNVHPFESYVKYLLLNGESPDAVVTNISFDSNADTMELVFAPLRGVTDEEYAVVKVAQAKPETKRYTMITVAQTDGVKKQPPAAEAKPAPKAVRSAEPEDDVELDAPVEPTKRTAKKQEAAPVSKKAMSEIVDAWGKDD
jgi:hypothetical protein